VRPEDFDFELPETSIAQHPSPQRADARMLVLSDAGVQHGRIGELRDFLEDRPLVVLNDSRVVPARLHVDRDDGRRFELLICEPGEAARGTSVRAWVRGAKRLRVGQELRSGSLCLRLSGEDPIDPRARLFDLVEGDLLATLNRDGQVPLPPYIRREGGASEQDSRRYQTVFAQPQAAPQGSVAAPTAGLHFDPALLADLEFVTLSLHVGPGTFLPMDCADVREHRVGSERYSVGEETVARIEAARTAGRPIFAIGTTVTRTLETLGRRAGHGPLRAGTGTTDLVIGPEHEFRVVDRLLTNFHLPRSSLLMLTCSFGGRERVLSAYRDAVTQGYRFYSYGDCMLITGRGRKTR